MTVAGLFLDILIVLLLAVTICYCWVLNRRIKVLQDSKSELAQLLGHFDESTQRASESIIALQTASKKIGENIQFRIDKANYLLDDLSYMIEKGNKLANQMEADIAINRARSRAMADAPAVAEKPAPVIEKAAAAPPKPPSARDKMATSLETMLERMAGRKPAVSSEAQDGRPPRDRQEKPHSRSRAEQELLDMIKAGIKG
ncbi:MAG: hypothetical protein KGI29_05980 [Pseudomonadota bacterium]|nr:hypothetical protein [Pseudomonadota bacterium]MDE3037111.1 hypothetical protein [Pseudomonadota bacterium]